MIDDDVNNSHNVPGAVLRKIARHMKALNAALVEVQKYKPNANWYLASDTLYLMRGAVT